MSCPANLKTAGKDKKIGDTPPVFYWSNGKCAGPYMTTYPVVLFTFPARPVARCPSVTGANSLTLLPLSFDMRRCLPYVKSFFTYTI